MRRAALVLLAVGVAGCGGEAAALRAAAPRATAPAERRDLVARVTIDGRLGFADERTLTSRLTGTVTWLAPEGSVVAAGHALFRVDDTPVILLDGHRPAWRAFTPGMTSGRDVRALERNLRALGYDPDHDMTVNRVWTSATTAAVERLQKRFGMSQTGTLDLGRVVFADGSRRVGEHKAKPGDPAGLVMTTTSTQREVTASLSTDDQGAARAGDPVRVTLPDGRTARGRITTVGSVAQLGQDGSASLDVTVALRGRGIPALDQAPVSVAVARQRVRGATAVPVSALVGRPGGGYAVEVVDGGRARFASVTPGLFADGWVEVQGVEPGTRVAVPQ